MLNKRVVVYYNGAQRYEQFLQIGRLYRASVLLGFARVFLAPLCFWFLWCYIIYYQNFFAYILLTIQWAEPGEIGPWCSWLTANHRPLVLWHCWLDHLTRKTVSEMTYYVSSGTLNPTIPYTVHLTGCWINHVLCIIDCCCCWFVQEGAFALAIKSRHYPSEIVVAR